MKTPKIFPLLLMPIQAAALFAGGPGAGSQPQRVILDGTAIRNLSIETEIIEETTFEETIFALGRIEAAPERRAIISSRIPGRVIEVLIRPAQAIEKNAPTVVVESRQSGNPPPTVMLSAPLSGLVGAINVVAGQPVEPSDSLAEIIDLAEVTAIARVPEHLSEKLRPGLTAHITAPAVPGQVFEAGLEYLGAQADAATGTVQAAFRVKNPDLALRPGMRAEFSIVVEKKDNAFSVPRSALQGDAADRYVFVKDFEFPNAFVKTPVVVGRINDRRAEILSGLFPADEVVTRGAYSLAFAGGGSVSLKEALDAAHGHAHAEDGSEPDNKHQKAATPADACASGAGHASANPLWMIVSGVLFALLVFVTLRQRRGSRAQ